MRGPREILNELKWRDDRDLSAVEIWYVHRGAPDDTRIVRGRDVLGLHTSFMEVRAPRDTAMIPYHRVFRIVAAGVPIWERRSRAAPEDTEGDGDENDDERRGPGRG